MTTDLFAQYLNEYEQEPISADNKRDLLIMAAACDPRVRLIIHEYEWCNNSHQMLPLCPFDWTYDFAIGTPGDGNPESGTSDQNFESDDEALYQAALSLGLKPEDGQ